MSASYGRVPSAKKDIKDPKFGYVKVTLEFSTCAQKQILI